MYVHSYVCRYICDSFHYQQVDTSLIQYRRCLDCNTVFHFKSYIIHAKQVPTYKSRYKLKYLDIRYVHYKYIHTYLFKRNVSLARSLDKMSTKYHEFLKSSFTSYKTYLKNIRWAMQIQLLLPTDNMNIIKNGMLLSIPWK